MSEWVSGQVKEMEGGRRGGRVRLWALRESVCREALHDGMLSPKQGCARPTLRNEPNSPLATLQSAPRVEP